MDGVNQVLVIGAGPAGLTAAYELAKHKIVGTIVEADEVVGGLARTIERDDYRFDVGAHRFFTKVAEIDRLWEEILGEPLQKLPRLTRILYDGKLYDYPLKAANALRNMGFGQAAACLASYAKARLFPVPHPVNFEQWVTNQFGAKLYRMFFKAYTEKVWGCPCTEIGADWAAQRIKGLSLGEAVRNAIFGQRKSSAVKTLIDEFKYPRRGPGELWEACARRVQERGWTIHTHTRMTDVELENRRVSCVNARNEAGAEVRYPAEHVFSSMPLRELLSSMRPLPPQEIVRAASSLAYRDFLIVALVLDKRDIFPDNWIYVHSPSVRVGRIDNFANWTKEMGPDGDTCCLAMEYFVFENDELWNSLDNELIAMAYRELGEIGLAKGNLLKGNVVRVPKAYPVYDPGYKQRLDLIRGWLRENVVNLHCIGRNGQHRYNNQDHSMATALIAARNVALGQNRDPWAVNEDAEYHEIAITEREAPLTPSPALIS